MTKNLSQKLNELEYTINSLSQVAHSLKESLSEVREEIKAAETSKSD